MDSRVRNIWFGFQNENTSDITNVYYENNKSVTQLT